MFFDSEYRRIGSIDAGPLELAVTAIGEAEWLAFGDRQQAYAAHRATQSIPLIFDPDFRHEAPTRLPVFDRYAAMLEAPMAAIRDFFAANPPPGTAGEGYFVRVLLVRLEAAAKIGSHRDHGHSLARAHRIHLPIITNPGVEFGIAGHIRHLAAGELWEVNNRKVHGVRNASDTHRIHAIFDYVVPGEVVPDPEGDLIA
ncbi:hypothetical protein DAH66_17520 [Sphingomonas koreensis]|uniref:Aspartyl/asparaginy/proline hydroxylase domain-containing protein n=1 Tax=Sphingomonas koreensis TaxID=93064 RepID=A0A430G0A4_9SPHN|nr:aspartyl/asparaginyl beta-hydroxylase domain-containing protein [Sphingomonas koreensis]RSY79365.1 hypothetical protein DAH66_17520 [Sphingomonas koreensis]